MKKDKLPQIISLITIVLFLIFAIIISRPQKELQGGDIQHAIETEQYR